MLGVLTRPTPEPIAPPAAARRSAVLGAPHTLLAAPEREPAARDGVPAQSGVQAYQRGDLEGARALFSQAIEENPRDAESLNNLGQVLVRLGRVAEAIDHLDRAVALNDRKWSYRFNRARAAGLMGDWTRAVADYRVADALFPDDHVTLFNLSLALHQAGDDAAANGLLRRVAALAPEEPDVHYALGLSEERLGRSHEAAAAYRRYLAVQPSADNAPLVQARIEHLTATTASLTAPR
jgi:tetratricopeptide (TPR) repeat protein